MFLAFAWAKLLKQLKPSFPPRIESSLFFFVIFYKLGKLMQICTSLAAPIVTITAQLTPGDFLQVSQWESWTQVQYKQDMLGACLLAETVRERVCLGCYIGPAQP